MPDIAFYGFFGRSVHLESLLHSILLIGTSFHRRVGSSEGLGMRNEANQMTGSDISDISD